MNLKTKRRYNCPKYCIGTMFVGILRFSDTLEDTDRGLTQDMLLSEITKLKKKGCTAIPKGTYEVDMNTISPKFKNRTWAKKYGGIVPRLVGVPGYSGVLIHPLNKPEETEGCIGVGENKVKGQIINSVDTYLRLMEQYLWPCRNRGERVFITIE